MSVADVDTMVDQLVAAGALPGNLTAAALRDGLSTLVAGGAAPITLDPRATLFTRGDVRDTGWLVLSGSLDEWGPNLRMSIRRPFDLCGEFAVAEGPAAPYTTTVQARVPTTLLQVPGEALRALWTSSQPLALVLVAQMAAHARIWSVTTYNQVSEYTLEEFPGALAQIAPAPYSLAGAVMYAFWVKLPTLPAMLSLQPPGGGPTVPVGGPFDLAMPPGVTPLLDCYLLTVNYFPAVSDPSESDQESGRYKEVVAMVPVVVGDDPTPRMFQAYLYTGQVMAMAAGREIYGFPKMGATTFIDPDIGRLLTRDGDENVFELDFSLDDAEISKDLLDAIVHGLETGEWPIGVNGAGVAQLLHALFGVAVEDVAKCVAQSLLPGGTSFRACLEAKLKAALLGLDAIHAAAWKRTYSPATPLPPGQAAVAWSPAQFQVDGVSDFSFTTTAIHELRLVEATGVRYAPGFLWSDVELAFPVGLAMRYDMTMNPGSKGMLLDFLASPPLDLSRLAWGPGVWALPQLLWRIMHPEPWAG